MTDQQQLRTEDRMERVRAALDGVGDRPLPEHVTVLGHSLDQIVAELDQMARPLPSAQ